MVLLEGDGAFAGAFAGAMRDLDIDEQKIQQVIDSMNRASQDLGGDGFRSGAHISPPAFGGSDRARELGDHHARAHRIVADTREGVTADLISFRDSTRQALVHVTDADQRTADDLTGKRAIAESMREVWQDSAGDRRNQESRNEHLSPGDAAPSADSRNG